MSRELNWDYIGLNYVFALSSNVLPNTIRLIYQLFTT
jgi:hypothetical protein